MNLALFVRPQPRTWLNHFFFFHKVRWLFRKKSDEAQFF